MRLESTCKPRKKHYVWDWNLPANCVKAWDFLPHFLLRSYHSSYQHWVHWVGIREGYKISVQLWDCVISATPVFSPTFSIDMFRWIMISKKKNILGCHAWLLLKKDNGWLCSWWSHAKKTLPISNLQSVPRTLDFIQHIYFFHEMIVEDNSKRIIQQQGQIISFYMCN